MPAKAATTTELPGDPRVPLVHIGYHKTASSWLQQAFFPALSHQITLYEHPALWEEVMLPQGLEFDVERCRTFLQSLVTEARAANRLPVFSSERLSGNPHSGGYDAAVMADRIRSSFDEVRVLVIVREQRAILASNYKQYIKMGGTCTLEEYLTPPWDGRVPLFRLDNFCYHHLVRYYQRQFGAEAVLVLPYELLNRQPATFAGALLKFMGIGDLTLDDAVFDRGVNVSMNDLQLRLKRWANYLSGDDSLHPVRPLAPLLASKLFRWIEGLEHSPRARRHSLGLPERVQAVVGDRYAASNRELQTLLNRDLAELGYHV